MTDPTTGPPTWPDDPTALAATPPAHLPEPAPMLPVGPSPQTPPQQPSSPQGDAGAALEPDVVLFNIGDIAVSRYWVVTPNGTAPLHGSAWIANDRSTTSERIPGYAIVLAIIFALACLLGLLFLLIKERTTSGYVDVQVRSGNLLHTTQVPVSSPADVARVRQMVAQAQSMAAQV
jgi:hypothetical protein